MNYTATGLCNLALDEIKGGTISSMNEPGRLAPICRRQYTQALAELLEGATWHMAVRRVALAETANDRASEWMYAYAVPAGVAIPIRIVPPQDLASGTLMVGQRAVSTPLSNEDQILYEQAGALYYTDLEGAVLEYVASDPDLGFLPATFGKAMIFALASKLIKPVKGGSTSEQTDLMQKAQVFMERAVANNNNRQPQRYGDYIPDSIKARF